LKHLKEIIFGLLFLPVAVNSFSQRSDSLIAKKHASVYGFPLLFYTPETRFGFGASGICLFNFKNDTLNAPRSTFNLGFAYTQNKQILSFLPFNLYIRNRSYQLYGELAYNRSFYNFYGVGNLNPMSFVERYGVEFPRVRITFLKKIMPGFYLGPRIAYDRYTLFNLDASGQLITRQITGSNGGVVSGLGLVCIHDSRDDVYYPTRGIWGEFVVYRNDERAGGTFNYTRLALDVSKYFSRGKNILALNAYSIYSDTDLPFFQMGVLGGLKKMRGFYEGRYRDNNLLVFQAEYRRHLFWLLGVTVFGDVGQVAHRYNQFSANYWRYTYGAGLRLRLDKNQKINLRMDIAVGNKQLLPYFTVGEAF
jgi:outer membrane protein assembly factor BamA